LEITWDTIKLPSVIKICALSIKIKNDLLHTQCVATDNAKTVR
jgi:hypothetical protein